MKRMASALRLAHRCGKTTYRTLIAELSNGRKTLEQSSHLGNFAYKKAVLNKYTHESLDSLAKIMINYTDLVIMIEGYTDGIGGVKYNLKLAQKRVDVCIQYLISKGVPPQRLVAAGFGEFQPIDQGGSDEAFSHNRRIELKLTER